MHYIETWEDVYYVASQQIMENIAVFIPKFLGAVVVMVIGVFLAFYLKGRVYKLVRRYSGLPRFSVKLISNLVKWGIILTFFMGALIQVGVAKDILKILFTGWIFMLSLAGGLAFGLAGKDSAKRVLENMKREK